MLVLSDEPADRTIELGTSRIPGVVGRVEVAYDAYALSCRLQMTQLRDDFSLLPLCQGPRPVGKLSGRRLEIGVDIEAVETGH